MAGSAATAVAIGSVAWYYHLYGTELHAMTPAEEGLVNTMEIQSSWALWADEITSLRMKR
jgi:hypothetical protein